MKDSQHDELKEYRDYLVSAIKEAQQSYDKTVITLASGGLVVSLAIIEKVFHPGQLYRPGFLYCAWVSWAVSLLVSLFAFLMGRNTLMWTLKQLDNGKLNRKNPGGLRARITDGANYAAGVAFVIGVVFLSIFTLNNLGRNVVESENAKSQSSEPLKMVQDTADANKAAHVPVPVRPISVTPVETKPALPGVPPKQPSTESTAPEASIPGGSGGDVGSGKVGE